MPTLRLGTRGSQLALVQARMVASLISVRTGHHCEEIIIKTSGDRLAEASLSEIGGKRLFVKEIEDALLAREIDVAVHSSKDMPAVLPEGLTIGAVLPREDPRDAMILPGSAPPYASLEEIIRALGDGPRIGTSSVRRTAQLWRLFPMARFAPIRGNLDTRMRKLDSGDYDALVLAAAGLRRLNHGHRVSAALPVDACVPAPGQGIVAVEIRSDDDQTRAVVAAINDTAAAAALDAERAVVERLGGGCQMPIGAYARLAEGTVHVAAVVISIDGERVVRAEATGAALDARAVGVVAADRLLERGAGAILAEARQAGSAVEGLQP
ncbi:MAG TPA: hydroxymethylbilane synthase [Vicinamibacterales bacterium]|nr:hydroxymethylbilane synthase [Vicinamibacterales bacterium]